MKSLLVCLLISVAFAQEDMMEGSGGSARLLELMDIQSNYEASLAVEARRQHLFCLNRTTSVDDNGNPNVMITPFEQNGDYVWTLFFQMPVISYLDPGRKQALMDVVLKVLDNSTFDGLEDICIGTYETYELSYFRESVLFHVYGRYSPFDAETLSTRFNDRVNMLRRSGNSDYVVSYPEQSGVVAINLAASDYFRNDSILQPRLQSRDKADPTVLAVLIGSYGFNITFSETVNSSVSRQMNGDDERRSFASNPNPINYGLEPGDIVFAVFGSILLTILGGLIILGYCIHPFCLA